MLAIRHRVGNPESCWDIRNMLLVCELWRHVALLQHALQNGRTEMIPRSSGSGVMYVHRFAISVRSR